MPAHNFPETRRFSSKPDVQPRIDDHSNRPPVSPLVNWVSLLQLLALLPVEIAALVRLSGMISGVILWSAMAVVNVLAFLAYLADKYRANSGDRRISENALHILSLMGGWPLAFVAQRMLRHKSSKPSFQAVYWLLVTLHLGVALAYLTHWKFC